MRKEKTYKCPRCSGNAEMLIKHEDPLRLTGKHMILSCEQCGFKGLYYTEQWDEYIKEHPPITKEIHEYKILLVEGHEIYVDSERDIYDFSNDVIDFIDDGKAGFMSPYNFLEDKYGIKTMLMKDKIICITEIN